MPTSNVYILDGCLSENDSLIPLQPKNHFLKNQKIETLSIDPLSTDWHSPLENNCFRSGCAPIEALEKAYELLSNKNVNIVKISGKDFLKTDYSNELRKKLMLIYGEHNSIPNSYCQLTSEFINKRNIPKEYYLKLRDLLIENYKRSRSQKGLSTSISEKWYSSLTNTLRGIDCANPYIDFSGEIYIVNDHFIKENNISGQLIKISSVKTSTIEDGPENIEQISTYDHLKSIFDSVSRVSNINVIQETIKDNCILDLYSCFPVVPLAFMYDCFELDSSVKLEKFLEKYSITIEGGMNLSKAAWNNPCLSSLVKMNCDLLNSEKEYGLIHGNSGLGYKQGIAILQRVTI